MRSGLRCMLSAGSLASNLAVFCVIGLASWWWVTAPQPACPGCPTSPTCPVRPGPPVRRHECPEAVAQNRRRKRGRETKEHARQQEEKGKRSSRNKASILKTSDIIAVPKLSKLRSVSVASATPDDLKRMRKTPCHANYNPVEKMRTAKLHA